MAQSSSFPSDPSCPSSISALGAAAPFPPSYLATILKDPEAYASNLCGLAAELPALQPSGFGAWGQSLLSYDALVTKCFVTGPEASAATSYIHR